MNILKNTPQEAIAVIKEHKTEMREFIGERTRKEKNVQNVRKKLKEGQFKKLDKVLRATVESRYTEGSVTEYFIKS